MSDVLRRTKERLQSGHVVTRTISYNKPRLAVARVVAELASRPSLPQRPKTPAAPHTAVDLLAGLRAPPGRSGVPPDSAALR